MPRKSEAGPADRDPAVKQPAAAADHPQAPRLYHGTRAAPKPGDLIAPGYASNYGSNRIAAYVYLTATLDAAIWGAELAQGDGPGRIYIVEPTDPIADDPNLTDKKYPGNPTRSYRTRAALRVVGEITEWRGHSAAALQAMKDEGQHRAAKAAWHRGDRGLSRALRGWAWRGWAWRGWAWRGWAWLDLRRLCSSKARVQRRALSARRLARIATLHWHYYHE